MSAYGMPNGPKTDRGDSMLQTPMQQRTLRVLEFIRIR